MDKTAGEAAAHEFFAQFTDPTPETVARVSQEASVQGDLAAVLAEAQAYNFDARKRARREQRKTDRAAAAAQEAEFNAAEAVRLAQHRARSGAPDPEVSAALPPARLLSRSTVQRRADQRRAANFWARLTDEQERQAIVSRARTAWEATQRAARIRRIREERTAAALRRAGAQAARADRLRQQREQREQRHREATLRREFHPSGMTAERALEIALAVLDRDPQARR